jgi:hypothetical protein
VPKVVGAALVVGAWVGGVATTTTGVGVDAGGATVGVDAGGAGAGALFVGAALITLEETGTPKSANEGPEKMEATSFFSFVSNAAAAVLRATSPSAGALKMVREDTFTLPGSNFVTSTCETSTFAALATAPLKFPSKRTCALSITLMSRSGKVVSEDTVRQNVGGPALVGD